MKNQIPGTLNVPASGIPTVGESVNALTEQVNNLQRRYYRALAPDCEVKTEADHWYFRAILWACAGMVFPPLVVVTALCLYKAKKCQKGGNRIKSITQKDIYVQAERLCTGTETSEYKYCLAYYGNYVMCDISAEDAREIIACLQHAKGGQNEK